MGMGQLEIPSPCGPTCLFLCLCAGLERLPDLDQMGILHDFGMFIAFFRDFSPGELIREFSV